MMDNPHSEIVKVKIQLGKQVAELVGSQKEDFPPWLPVAKTALGMG
jgi:hypothetical protein